MISAAQKFIIVSFAFLSLFLTGLTLPETASAGNVNLSVPSFATPGSTITVSWTGLNPRHYQDWIGFYYASAGDSPEIDWFHANTCAYWYSGEPGPSGSCQFTIPSWASTGQQFNFRLFGYGSYDKYGTSNTLTIGSPPAVQPTCSSAGPDGDTNYTGSGTRRTYIYGVANATAIYLPTWTQQGGQDDIVWYQASVYSGSTWYYDIPIASHNQTGNVYVHAYMYNSSYSGIFCDEANFVLQNPPSASVYLNANGQDGSLSVGYNTPITLSWGASNATSCTAGGTHPSWQGSQSLSGGWNSPALTSTHTFSITCSGTGGSGSDSVTVNVSPPGVSLSVPSTAQAGTTITVSWSGLTPQHYLDWIGFYYTSSADSNYLDWFHANTCAYWYSGNPPASGSCQFTIPSWASTGQQFNFRLFGYGSYDKYGTSNTLTISPPPPATVYLHANGQDGSLSVAYSTQITLSWGSTNATSCTASSSPASSWTGGQSLSGGWNSPALTTTHTFNIVCSGAGASGSDSVTVYVGAPPPVPTCTNATPDNEWTTATSGTRLTYANGVANATTVYFPTWTTAGGQNDIVWYTGTNQGGGVWRGDINLASHTGIDTINVHVYMYTALYGNTWCDSASFSRVGGDGRINVNSNINTSWTLTCALTNPACPTYTGTNTSSGEYNNVPYSTWTITPANVPGYNVQVQPSNPRTLP